MDYTNLITGIFCGVIVIYALWAISKIWPIRSLAVELERYQKILQEIKREKNEENIIDPDSNYCKYEASVAEKTFKQIQENIDDFNKELVEKEYQDVESENYFNEVSLLGKFNLQAINQKGPTLVGLGVLGTFVGLSYSLYQIGDGKIISEQISIIDKIIPRMSLAFLTSVAGMFSSIVYTRCQKNWIGGVIKEINQINYTLERIFPATDSTKMLFNIQTSVQNLASTLSKELGTSVTTAINQSKDNLFGTFTKSMNQNMGSMSKTLSQTVSNSLNQIFNQEFLDNFKGVQESLVEAKNGIADNNKTFMDISQQLPKVINKFKMMNDVSNSIFENAQKSMLEYDRYMKGTADFLISMEKMKELQEKIEKSVESLSQITTKSYGELEAATNKNYQNLNQATMELLQQYKVLNIEFNGKLTETFIKNEDLLNKMNKLIDKNSGNIIELDKTMTNSVKNIVDGMEKRKKDFDNQHKQITENQEKLEQEIGKALSAYDGVVSEATEKMKDIVLNMKEMQRQKDE